MLCLLWCTSYQTWINTLILTHLRGPAESIGSPVLWKGKETTMLYKAFGTAGQLTQKYTYKGKKKGLDCRP